MPQNEKVQVKLPNGETVVAIVPAGMDDAQVGTLMRQKHPEYFPKQPAVQPSDDDRSQIAGAMARMPQSDTTPQSEQGPVRRFAERAFGIPDRAFDKPGEYLNPFSRSYWNPTPQRQADIASMVPGKPPTLSEMVPGRQTIADIKARNYAGAAGDVVPDALAVAQMAVPAAGEVLGLPSVSRLLPRVGRYAGAGLGYKAGGPLGAAAGGISGDLAGRGLAKLAPRMARSVGVAAPAEEPAAPATTAAKIQQIRGAQRAPAPGAGSTASLAKQATDEALARSQSPDITPTEPAAPAVPKPTINVDDLVSTGRNLGLSPTDAKVRAQEAVTQFPNDENAAIQYMAGRRAPVAAQTPAAKAEQIKAVQQEQRAATAPAQPKFTLAPVDKNAGAVLMKVDPAKMDAAIPRDSFYVGKGGEGVEDSSAMPGRYKAFQQWLKDNPDTPIEAPRVGMDKSGNIGFTNGRHRFAVLRDMGVPEVQISVEPSQVGAFAEKLGAKRAGSLPSVSGGSTPAGIVNDPKFVSQRQRSNLAKNQRQMGLTRGSVKDLAAVPSSGRYGLSPQSLKELQELLAEPPESARAPGDARPGSGPDWERLRQDYLARQIVRARQMQAAGEGMPTTSGTPQDQAWTDAVAAFGVKR